MSLAPCESKSRRIESDMICKINTLNKRSDTKDRLGLLLSKCCRRQIIFFFGHQFKFIVDFNELNLGLSSIFSSLKIPKFQYFVQYKTEYLDVLVENWPPSTAFYRVFKPQKTATRNCLSSCQPQNMKILNSECDRNVYNTRISPLLRYEL